MASKSLPTLGSAAQLQPKPLNRELTPVEDWGFEIWISALTAGELDEYRAPMYEFDPDKGKMKLNMRGQNARLAALAIQDEHRNRIFPDVEEGIERINDLGAAGAEVVAKVARRLSGLDDDSAKAMEGNSEAGQTGDSPSA